MSDNDFTPTHLVNTPNPQRGNDILTMHLDLSFGEPVEAIRAEPDPDGELLIETQAGVIGYIRSEDLTPITEWPDEDPTVEPTPEPTVDPEPEPTTPVEPEPTVPTDPEPTTPVAPEPSPNASETPSDLHSSPDSATPRIVTPDGAPRYTLDEIRAAELKYTRMSRDDILTLLLKEWYGCC